MGKRTSGSQGGAGGASTRALGARPAVGTATAPPPKPAVDPITAFGQSIIHADMVLTNESFAKMHAAQEAAQVHLATLQHAYVAATDPAVEQAALERWDAARQDFHDISTAGDSEHT